MLDVPRRAASRVGRVRRSVSYSADSSLGSKFPNKALTDGSSMDGAVLTKRNVGPAPSSRKPKAASRRLSGLRRGNARMNLLKSDAVRPAASSNSGPARAPINTFASDYRKEAVQAP